MKYSAPCLNVVSPKSSQYCHSGTSASTTGASIIGCFVPGSLATDADESLPKCHGGQSVTPSTRQLGCCAGDGDSLGDIGCKAGYMDSSETIAAGSCFAGPSV